MPTIESAPAYVVLQYGGPIYGVGDTEAAAWADAAEWMDEPLTADTTAEPRVDGAVYCLPATAALADRAREDGAVAYEVRWPSVLLPDEADALDLLRDAIEVTGGSARAFSGFAGVDERTVRRWLAADRAIPGPARQLCRLLVAHPELAAELRPTLR